MMVTAIATLLVSTLVPAEGRTGDQPTTTIFVVDGKPVLLDDFFALGRRTKRREYLEILSATIEDAPAYGSHYISIGMHGGKTLVEGDFHVAAKVGLIRKDSQPVPLVLSLQIGYQHFDLAVEKNQAWLKGVMLDAVQYQAFERPNPTTVPVDGKPFLLECIRRDRSVKFLIDGSLVNELNVPPSRGPVGLTVERVNLLRVANRPDVEAELRVYDFRASGRLVSKTAEEIAWQRRVGTNRSLRRIGTAFAYVEDQPELPNVLLIGDSISLYYTGPVRRLLRGKADVFRTPMGPGKAETLFASLDAFLKEKHWDVIHFNTGLHDMARKQGTDEDLARYRANLETIVAKLQKTGAKLIWANTTPIPEKAPGSSKGVEVKYNAVAEDVMRTHKIPVDDLYSVILPRHDEYWLRFNNIHFNMAGSAALADQVARFIAGQLESTSAGGDQAPQTVLRSQGNEADVVRLPDGSLRLLGTDRFRTETYPMFSRTSTDHGRTWTQPAVEFVAPRRAFGSKAIVDRHRRLHVFYLMLRGEGRKPGVDRLLDIWHVSKDAEIDGSWNEPKRVFEGYVGALLGVTQLRSGRMLLPFAHWVGDRPAAPPTGPNVTTVVYSDDDGTTWHPTGAALTSPCYDDYNGSNYGAIEPDVIELADRRVWMLMRTQTGLLYESFSKDGIEWSKPAPSRFYSGNGPVAFLRLPDKRIMLFWNNCELPSRVDGQGVYGGRDELHAAISADEGCTWRGFRTIYRDPNRNRTPPRRGDRGTAYPDAEVTEDGTVVVTAGHGEPAGVVRFKPDWLTQTSAREDFSRGVDAWCTFKHFGPSVRWWRDRVPGARLIDHSDKPNRKVLQLRRPDEKPGDGAVWNFPLGWKGSLTARVKLGKGFGGASISLNDRFFNPCDDQGETMAMFTVPIPPDGNVATDIRLEPGNWHNLRFDWDLDTKSCVVSLDGRKFASLDQQNVTLNGLCFLRLRSIAEILDAEGFLVESVAVTIDDPFAPVRNVAEKRSRANYRFGK